ncbi:hypothetical protein A3K82_00715 [Candidatus Pacearchaeota archaeon RBG_19FT_COMBO_34_9]|nr:MAG: hypothetical protein A3K82_00715 [Candidatus Pacearchaeota archaeon RBG_19FT_COMBO_34_9]
MNWKGILGGLLIFIIGSLIVSFLIYPNSFQSFKSNINGMIIGLKGDVTEKMNIIEEDSMIKQCKIEFNRCKEVAEAKYDTFSLSLIKIEKFINMENATEFYNTWNFAVLQSYHNLPNDFPYVLMAVKISSSEGSMSMVRKCDENGMEGINIIGLNLC